MNIHFSPRRRALWPVSVAAVVFSLVHTTELLAQAAEAGAGQPAGPSVFRLLPLFIIVFAIFYFLVLSPQNKRIREQQSLLESLKKGEAVITSSGILGRVANVEEQYVVLDVGGNTKVKFQKEHISQRPEKPSEKNSVSEKKKGK